MKPPNAASDAIADALYAIPVPQEQQREVLRVLRKLVRRARGRARHLKVAR